MAERAPVERDVAGSNPVPRPEITPKTKVLTIPLVKLSASRERPPGRFWDYYRAMPVVGSTPVSI